MIPTGFEYHRATSLDDAITKLTAAKGRAKLIAGGHSLVPLMKLRLSEPEMLIDISRVRELSGIRETAGQIEIGAATVHDEIGRSTLLHERCPMLAEAAAEIGDAQVRNRGTIGGSLAHADPAADYPAVVLALDAEIQIRGPRGSRAVRASEFFKDLLTVDLASDEIIAGIRFVPVRSAAYAKLHQRASRYAIVGVAAALETSGGTIQSARIGLTGAGPKAVRLTKVEQALAGKRVSRESIDEAARSAGADVEGLNADIHASAEYRRAMIPVFTRRALHTASDRVS